MTAVSPTPSRAVRPGFQHVAAAVGAAAAGVLLHLSFPPYGWWWTAPVAFVFLGAVLRGRRARVGAGLGLLAGLGLFVPLLSWTGEFVGPLPWLALAAVQAAFISLAGAGIARLPVGALWPLSAAAVWVAAEALRARIPFDGFPWGRVAFGQADGPFVGLVTLGGTSFLSFAVALTGFAALAVVRSSVFRPGPVSAAVLLAVLLAPAVSPLLIGPPEVTGRLQVALVQGNVPRVGLDFNTQRRAVLDNHVRRTEQLAADVAAGRVPSPDLVIWPENSADIDPLRNPDARTAIDQAVRAIGVPVLVGAVLTPPDGPPTNTMIVWDPATGPGERHDKRRLQPFGEYMPYREFFRLFSPLVDRASNFAPGDGDGVLSVDGVAVGIATCYEVIFDDLVRDTVRGGAELLAVPSNNATFGFTDMTFQQLAIDRVRAIEFGRSTVVPTTSGVSAIIRPDGSVLDTTSRFEPAVLVAELPLRHDLTPAARIGNAVEWLLVVIGVASLLVPRVHRLAARVRGGG